MVRLDIIRKRAARILLRLPLKYKKSQLYDEYKILSQGEKGDSKFCFFYFRNLKYMMNINILSRGEMETVK
jgi:hypothetical protein